MAVVGWILLGILGLLLLLFLLVLFFPVSYRLEVEKTPERLSVKAAAGWLMGLFRILFFYPDPGKPQIRIAWFALNSADSAEGEKTKTGPEKKAGEKPPETARAKPVQAESRGGSQDNSSGEPGEDGESPKDSETSGGASRSEASDRQKNGGSKKGFGGNIAEGYKKIRAEAEFYWKLWQKEETRSLVSEILARLFKIFRNVFPRRIEGSVVFGAESPDITGYALAVYSVVRVYFPKRLILELTPDFEEPVLKGKILIRGHATLAVILWNVLRAALDKRLRKLWREVSRHIS